MMPCLTPWAALSWSAGVSIISDHTLGGLPNSNVFSPSSETERSEVKVSAGLASAETSLFGLPLRALPWCAHERENSPPLYKATNPIGLGPTLRIPFNLKYLIKKTQILSHRRVGLQHMDSWGHNSVHKISFKYRMDFINTLTISNSFLKLPKWWQRHSQSRSRFWT